MKRTLYKFCFSHTLKYLFWYALISFLFLFLDQNHIHIPKQFNNIITNQNHKQYKFMIEKYNTKYNLISFILLRKNDEYLGDYRYYFTDQSLYQKVDRFIEQRQLEPLRELFTSKETEVFGNIHNPEVSLTNFTNSYNCNLFVYAIRKCFETQADLQTKGTKPKTVLVKTLDENNNEIFVEEEKVIFQLFIYLFKI